MAELPRAVLPRDEHPRGRPAGRRRAGGSRSAARRTVDEGGAYVNNVKVTTEAETLTPADLLHGRWLLLRRGRKTLAAVGSCATGGCADAPPAACAPPSGVGTCAVERRRWHRTEPVGSSAEALAALECRATPLCRGEVG